jgi:aspartyl-tRNA synthetase
MTRSLKKDNEGRLDCLVVKQGASQLTGGDLKMLIKGLELTDTEQHHFGFVKINDNNQAHWQQKCGGGLRQGMETLSADEQQRMNRELNVEQGDIVFVHQRPDYLYVNPCVCVWLMGNLF